MFGYFIMHPPTPREARSITSGIDTHTFPLPLQIREDWDIEVDHDAVVYISLPLLFSLSDGVGTEAVPVRPWIFQDLHSSRPRRQTWSVLLSYRGAGETGLVISIVGASGWPSRSVADAVQIILRLLVQNSGQYDEVLTWPWGYPVSGSITLGSSFLQVENLDREDSGAVDDKELQIFVQEGSCGKTGIAPGRTLAGSSTKMESATAIRGVR